MTLAHVACSGARIPDVRANQLGALSADTNLVTISIGGNDAGFVDARTPFSGHRICDDVEWLNGLSNPTGESYHPNRLGHDEFTALIAARL